MLHFYISGQVYSSSRTLADGRYIQVFFNEAAS
jgi:hypothetical protein